MIDRVKTVSRGVAAQRLKIGVPVLACGFEKIQQAAADATDSRNFKLAGPNRIQRCVACERSRKNTAIKSSNVTDSAVKITRGWRSFR